MLVASSVTLAMSSVPSLALEFGSLTVTLSTAVAPDLTGLPANAVLTTVGA